jgi:hypothetical protein
VNNDSSVTVMLGLEGMAVLAVSGRDGELGYALETTAAPGWCPVCGAIAREFGVAWATLMAWCAITARGCCGGLSPVHRPPRSG